MRGISNFDANSLVARSLSLALRSISAAVRGRDTVLWKGAGVSVVDDDDDDDDDDVG